MQPRAARLVLLGLGMVAGALLRAEAVAQEPSRPPSRDTVVRVPVPPQPDTIARRDSAARTGGPAAPLPARADSMQAPLARAELPVLTDAAHAPLSWTRDSLLATGALTLADLLDRVPGLVTLRTAWLGRPSVGAYLGDVTRVRVFMDGLELDPEEPRGGAAFDLSRVPLWSLDELRVERTAGEVRVHVRTWTVERTTPYSRVDVLTGDQDTDLFRFFFGRRFGNGLAVQAAVDQFSTTPDRVGATSSQTSILTRVGWARRQWQADAFLLRQTPQRGVLFADLSEDSIPALDLTRTEAYLRAGYGQVDGPLWAQVVAGANGYRHTGVPRDSVEGDTILPPAIDTSRFQAQYAFSAGMRRGIARASVTHRLRLVNGEAVQTPSARAGLDWRMLAASASVEGRGVDSVARGDVSLRLAPLDFVRLGASLSVRDDARGSGSSGTDWRAEGALRLAGIWVGGGIMARDSARLPAPLVFGQPYVGAAEPGARGAFATVQGRVWGPLQVDLVGEAWQDSVRAYRPRFTTRADVFIRSGFPQRFPRGNFGLYALLRHEYRSSTRFPLASGAERTPGHRIITGLLEVRILDATLTYQFRNLVGTRFLLVPDFAMARQAQFYGVRWAFWN